MHSEYFSTQEFSFWSYFSHKTATELMDRVNESHDSLVVDMKAKVETMLSSCKTEREKASCARAGAAGCSFFGDNVGKVISPRLVF